jgi:ribosomal protein S20
LKGTSNIMQKIAWTTLCFGLAIGLAGCRHKQQLAPLPPVMAPVALEDIPEPDNLPMVEAPPENLPPVPVSTEAGKPKRKKKQPPKIVAPPEALAETQVANAAAEAPTPDAAVGALTAGGETNPQTKQEAEDLIASIDKRLNALPAQKVEEQKAQVSKVRNFWKDAQEALKSGDAEGAKTLATKAKLLLDDLEK